MTSITRMTMGTALKPIDPPPPFASGTMPSVWTAVKTTITPNSNLKD